jgi:hypothetical protein
MQSHSLDRIEISPGLDHNDNERHIQPCCYPFPCLPFSSLYFVIVNTIGARIDIIMATHPQTVLSDPSRVVHSTTFHICRLGTHSSYYCFVIAFHSSHFVRSLTVWLPPASSGLFLQFQIGRFCGIVPHSTFHIPHACMSTTTTQHPQSTHSWDDVAFFIISTTTATTKQQQQRRVRSSVVMFIVVLQPFWMEPAKTNKTNNKQ